MTDAGVTVVAASGNDGTSPCSNPASFGPTISVGATDWGDTQASFSNYGKCVDILAPGVQIKIAAHTGGHRFASGTSLAAPYVAGAAAIYLAKNPAASPDAVRSHLLSNATTNALHGLQGSPNRLLYVAPDKAVTVVQRPVNNECWQQESLASASDREPQSCSEAALPAAGVSNLIEAYGQQDAPQETTGNTCFGPIAAGSGTGNAKQAFETPIAEGGCGMAWDDQLGHQCRWVDEPTAGWQCFGAQPNRPRQPNPQTTPRPAVDPPFSQSDVDQPQQVQLQNDQSNDTLEARNAAAETKPVGQSGSQPEGSVCRSRVVAGVNLDQARQDFAKPVDQGGCGIAWDDQNLGHQCEWISGSPQGWQCFGTVQ